MRKSYNYVIILNCVKKKLGSGFRSLLDPDSDFWLDPDPGSDFWLDPDPDPGSINTDPKH